MFTIKDSGLISWYQKVTATYPKARSQSVKLRTAQVRMRDGILLNTRIFLPDSSSPYDVLFTRNPYPANESICEAIYTPFVEQGYCMIIQDCRGTGDSEGLWDPFQNERNDGIDSLNWLQAQDWVRSICTFGRSYSAFTQWIVGDVLPEKVKTMVLEVYGVNRFDQVYCNGVFREDIYTSWAFANSGVKSDLSPAEQYRRAISLYPADKRDIEIVRQQMPFYQDYLRETDMAAPYWTDGIWQTLRDVPSKITVPVLITDGWADHHLQGSLIGFRELRPDVRARSRLIVTPGDHIGSPTGKLTYDDAQRFGFMNLRANLDWFNHIVRGTEEIFDSAVYLMRGNRWVDFDSAKAMDQKYYLGSRGELSEESSEMGSVEFDYDPRWPNTWPGGNELLAWITPGFTDLPHGFTMTDPYPDRSDVVRFETHAFFDMVMIAGEIKVHLEVSSDCEDTAFAVRLCEHTADDLYINIKDGISALSHQVFDNECRYEPGAQTRIDLSLGDIAWELQPGSSILLLISSSNFPMYAIHSNKSGPWSAQTIEAIIAHQRIFTGAHQSYVELPLAVRSE
ncbi:hydrolase CocE/NonD family protein [Coriobacterium glomerans PW2]|uniref:Hydrolase CocE/NonD family protein n=1 Tax=Coriobacterium glomerans (strain ATCC 49209 / DSM 20642 / JCM 10262 / PW2) TaxID=700015 RepID=F2N921_CORGP|nr:CocE/NonD family hydrolase [Coriobacterium glomerans]AEB07697.1 hydrolase CocE/NonD family protein [Coriobacterium glomerans PW2]